MVVNDYACDLDERGAFEPIASNRASTDCSCNSPGLRDEPFFCHFFDLSAKPSAMRLPRFSWRQLFPRQQPQKT
ncbi:UNVERIFIED_ORG: hypothetical protein OKW15_004484 [Pseudomonas reinekei]|nr:hypothetical protein [Pseudomonas reinekei]